MIEIEMIVDDLAYTPVKGRELDACYDLLYDGRDLEQTGYNPHYLIIPPGKQCLLPTGVKLNIPEGYAAFIWPRSGLAVKQSIDTRAGVIDAGYQGEIQVLIRNEGTSDVIFEDKDRIAQMYIAEVPKTNLSIVESFDQTERGIDGFGSSGR